MKLGSENLIHISELSQVGAIETRELEESKEHILKGN